MSETESADMILREWLRDTGVAVLNRRPDGAFEIVGAAPPYFADMARAEGLEPHDAARDPRAWSPFLANFLIDAEAFWRRARAGRALSGPWCETTRAGGEFNLEAAAVRLHDGRELLVIEHLKEEYGERLAALQQARSLGLEFDRLQREVQDKEVLLHCIVHDLKGPLSTMYGSLSLLASGAVKTQKAAEMAQLGLEECRRQAGMLDQILEVFRAEIEELNSYESEQAAAPDARQCLRVAMRALQAAFEQRNVHLRASPKAVGGAPLKVCGRVDRLQRVLVNLLDNALRHSRPGSDVEVECAENAEGARISINDRGEGVAPQIAKVLFQRFVTTRPGGGPGGLGLYYCRRTVEAWGGRIGFDPREGGGSSFWIQLPLAK